MRSGHSHVALAHAASARQSVWMAAGDFSTDGWAKTWADVLARADGKIAPVPNSRAGALRAAALTAEAFRDDPFNAWVFGGVPAMQSVFGHLARAVYAPAGYSYRLGDMGACMWLPPGVPSTTSAFRSARIAASLLRRAGPRALSRALAADSALSARKPAQPHAYLFTIGLVESARGKGHGSTLIGPVLEMCDRRAWPVYLESSNPDNHGYYAAKGFRTTEIFTVRDSPPVEGMIREPRPPISRASGS